MKSNDRESDDLTTIKGIGRARQQWLRESLGVRTYRDLAALSTRDIEARLKADRQVASRNEIEGWIAQAQKLAAADDLPSRQHPEVAEPEASAASPARQREWQPFASFVVEYQTRQLVAAETIEHRTMVHYMEADRGETWPGVESERLCRWMVGQVSQRLQSQPEEKLLIEEPTTVESLVKLQLTEASAVMLKVDQLRAFQPVRTGRPSIVGGAGRPFLGSVRGNEPFAIEASFKVSGPAAPRAAREHRLYRAQFYAQERVTGSTAHLGATQPNTLLESRLSYTVILPQATLPPGMYRLWVLVTLQVIPPLLGYLEAPLLQVT